MFMDQNLKPMKLLPLLLILLVACGTPKRHTSAVDSSIPADSAKPSSLPPFYFKLPLPPADLDAEGRQAFLRDHFWDNFPFADSTLLTRLDTLELKNFYVAYVGQVLSPTDTAAMRLMMQQADASKPMLEKFHRLAEEFLYDPNSPVRNDELYIPVLEQVVASPHYDEYEKLAPAYELELVRQNRVGHRANNFRYTLADGTSGTLYTLRATYTLLFISNPGCPMCRAIREQISESPYLSELIERGELKVLMLYPDEDLTEWHAHRAEIPASWINAYDKGMQLQRNRLYDMKAIPSLYLLDRNKYVLLKDVVNVALVEHTLLASQ